MSVLEKLNRLDAKLVPIRRYNTKRPLWFALGGPVGAVAGVLGAQVTWRSPLAVAVPVDIVLATLVVAITWASWRWDKAHRIA